MVKGAGTTGVVGVLVVDGQITMNVATSASGRISNKKAGDVIDVMTAGEIVEATMSDGTTPLDPGTTYHVDPATGLLTATAAAMKKVGFAPEADRLVVRVGGSGTGA